MKRLTEDQVANFKQAFDEFDKDGNGNINREEIMTVFRDLEINLSAQQADRIMNMFDENGDECIQFEEFLTVLSKNIDQYRSERWLFQVFSTIDANCDGLLSQNELNSVARLFKLNVSEEDIKLIVESCDVHQEGGINYQQFSKILMK